MTTAARAAVLSSQGFNVSSTPNGGTAVSGGQTTPAPTTPTQVAAAVSKSVGYGSGGSTNPHDAPGYDPNLDPTSTAYGKSPVGAPSQPTTSSTVVPAGQTPPPNTTQPAPGNAAPGASPEAPQALTDAVNQASQKVDALKQKYTQAHSDLKGSGVQPPSSQGSANAGIDAAVNSQPKDNPVPETPPSVTSFLDPATNPIIDTQTKALRDLLSPPAQRQALTDAISQLATDKSSLNGLKTELMNVKNIMKGSQQDIMDEVTKAGGTISESLLANLTIARNRALVTESQQLADQIQSAQDAVATDTTLVSDEKSLASTQFTENMSLLNFQQTNYNNQLNAARDSIKMLLGPNMENAASVYKSVQGTPYEARYEQVLGLPSGGLAYLATVQSSKALQEKATLQHTLLENQKLIKDLGGGGNTTTSVSTPNGQVNVPTELSPYVRTAYNGDSYVDLSSLSGTLKNTYAQSASKAGLVPILTTGDSSKVNAISDTKTNLQNIQDSLAGILNDKEVPSSQGIGNSIKGALGNADIGSFKAWRTAIINSVQALAGGAGSGLRINKAEIDSAMQNDLPVITGIHADNLATANAKIAKLNSQLDTWTKQILGGGNVASSHVPPVGTVIQKDGKSYHVIDDQGNIQPI